MGILVIAQNFHLQLEGLLLKFQNAQYLKEIIVKRVLLGDDVILAIPEILVSLAILVMSITKIRVITATLVMLLTILIELELIQQRRRLLRITSTTISK